MKSINGSVVGLAVMVALAVSSAAGAQSLTPPVPGMVTVDGQVQQEGVGVETIVGKAAQGVGHAFAFTKRLFAHGRTNKGEDSRQSGQTTGTLPVAMDANWASPAAAESHTAN